MVEEGKYLLHHFAPMTDEEIAKVEELVNANIMKAESVVTEELSIEEAKEKAHF